MQQIQAPVNPDSPKAVISNLHDALAAFLQKDVFRLSDSDRRAFEDGLRAERQDGKFGDITRKLVSVFQEARRIQPASGMGFVDESTAKEMNALLKEFGLLDTSVAGLPELLKVLDTQTRVLTALTASTDRLSRLDLKIDSISSLAAITPNTRGDAVKNLHAQLSSIGVVLPANETAESIFGVGTRDALMQFQEKYNLSKSGILDDATRNALEIVVGLPPKSGCVFSIKVLVMRRRHSAT